MSGSIKNRLALLLALTLAACLACCKTPLPEAAARPNIVIFIADDVSVDDIGVYGNHYVSTPNLDRLAASGLQCNRAFLTTSSCSPSRASILTGRYPHNTGAPELHMPVPGQLPTLAGELRANGYYTGASGKWHLGPSVRSDFDSVLDSAIGPGGEDRWLELVHQVPEEQPFFLWLASLDAHRPWDLPSAKDAKTNNVPVPPYLLADEATRNDLASYYSEIQRFDTSVGSVVQALQDKGMLKNTVLIVLADNGRPFPRDKTRLYDSGLQTPLIIHWDAAPAIKGKSSNALISVIDLAPTLTQLAGLETSPTFQGISFAHLFDDVSSEHRNYVFGEHNWHDYAAYERMVRSDSFLLIENLLPEKPMSSAADVHAGNSFQALVSAYRDGNLDPELLKIHFRAPRPELELYQVGADPRQLTNLAGSDAYSEVREAMRRKLKEWKKRTCDALPDTLTADHYDFYSARALYPNRQYDNVIRGNVPGRALEALQSRETDAGLQE